jgi:hypothetical protein
MFCPRCGAENDDDNRFCVGCGASLAPTTRRRQAGSAAGAEGSRAEPDQAEGSAGVGGGPPATPAPASAAPSRFEEVIGTSRRARIVTALTVLALAVAVVAFFVLRSNDSEGGVAQDTYLRSLDRQCVQEKARLSALEAETLEQKAPDFATFVNFLVRDVTEWHSNLQATPPPPEHEAGVREVEGALLEVLIEAGRLGTAVRRGSQTEIVKAAERVDAATGQVDPALEYLGLQRCAAMPVKAL